MDTRPDTHQLGIEWLLDPLPLSTFMAEYWEQKPLHLTRERPDYYNALMSLHDLDTLLGSALTNSGVRTAKDGNASTVGIKGADKTTLCDFYDLYYQGHTIVVQDVHLRWPPIDRVGASLSKELGCRIGTHLYPTPQGNQGFGTHWDDHDIFALQLEGEKEWSLYDTGPKLPRYSASRREYNRHSVANPGEPSVTITLKAGDLLYFPKGTIHRVRSTTKASLHLTYGLYPETWEHLVVESLKGLARRHPGLQQALPIGFLAGAASPDGVGDRVQELLALMRDELDWKEACQRLGARVVSAIRPMADGHFEQLASAHALDGETRICKRNGMLSALTSFEDGITLHFPGGQHRVPRAMEAALQYIHNAKEPIRVGDIPGNNDDELLVLIRTLIGKGYLRLHTA